MRLGAPVTDFNNPDEVGLENNMISVRHEARVTLNRYP